MVGAQTLKEFVSGSIVNRKDFEANLQHALTELEKNYLADFQRANELCAQLYFNASSCKRDLYERLVDTAQ